MCISVLGCGRWGAFIAWYLSQTGHQISLYGKQGSLRLAELRENRTNGVVVLDDHVNFTNDLDVALRAQWLIISVPSQNLRCLCKEIKEKLCSKKKIILCMKGLEIGTGKRLSEIVEEELGELALTAVWLGPGHVQEFCAGVPNCMVIDSDHTDLKEEIVELFSSDLIRFYYGQDLIGNEVGAAAKNVIGIAAGMLDGLKLSSLKGALMSRGTREVARLIKSLGGNELSAYGLCHLGDYEATVFSRYSHNRMFGENWIKGKNFTALAEGFYTVKAIMLLAEREYVSLPICEALNGVLYHQENAEKSLNALFSRTLKKEF